MTSASVVVDISRLPSCSVKGSCELSGTEPKKFRTCRTIGICSDFVLEELFLAWVQGSSAIKHSKMCRILYAQHWGRGGTKSPEAFPPHGCA